MNFFTVTCCFHLKVEYSICFDLSFKNFFIFKPVSQMEVNVFGICKFCNFIISPPEISPDRPSKIRSYIPVKKYDFLKNSRFSEIQAENPLAAISKIIWIHISKASV